MDRWLILLLLMAMSFVVSADAKRYDNVAQKYKDSALSPQVVGKAKMQGECLVQLKELTFKRKDKFDPISEWVNYRSVSLLQQYSPCEVLIMLEVANKKIRDESKP